MANKNEGANRNVKMVFGTAAFISVVAGLAIYLASDSLGLDKETAQLVALVFLAVGFLDYMLLRFWDRLFKPSQDAGD